uniref:Uncharacterized protein n=1 Tax=Anguilla anguilla TaxID=7936 RepID=A0A0E9S241_ANGAN
MYLKLLILKGDLAPHSPTCVISELLYYSDSFLFNFLP